MKKITLWYKYNSDKDMFEYNHYSDGWQTFGYPPMQHGLEQFRKWLKERWVSEFAYIDDTSIIHFDEL